MFDGLLNKSSFLPLFDGGHPAFGADTIKLGAIAGYSYMRLMTDIGLEPIRS